MSVRPRGNSWQVDCHHQGKRVRKDGFASKGEAEQYERDVKSKLVRGEAPTSSSSQHCETLQNLLDKTIARYWTGSKGEATSVKNAEDCVTLLGGDRHPKTISLGSIDLLVEEFRKRKLSDATINRKLAALSKMLSHAASRGWIDRLPKIERLKESKGRVRWYSAQEELTILRWYEMKGWLSMRDFCIVLVDTGARLSECLEMRFDRCADGMVRLYHTKNGGNRAVPMTTRVKLLVERRRASRSDDTRVFEDLDYWSVQNAWKVQREALGQGKDEEWVIHTFRHTFGSRLAQRGVDMLSIMQLMGHRSLSVTQRYSHLSPHNLTSAVAMLEPQPELVHA